MKLYFSIIAAVVVSTAHAEDWVYHAHLERTVAMYVDMASVKTVQTLPHYNAEIRTAIISLGEPGEDATMRETKVICHPGGPGRIYHPSLGFVTVKPDKTFGLLVARICAKLL